MSATRDRFPGIDLQGSVAVVTGAGSGIGRAAAAMVQPGDSIVLDSGTTTLQIARHLPDADDVTVLTNDLDILAVLARKERLNVVMLGGQLRRRNMAFYGAQTVAALEDLHVDKLFLGVDGFDVDLRAASPDESTPVNI